MKKYDVVAVTGEWTNSAGEKKKRYMNVGVMLDTGNGPFIVLERWFNPSGLPNNGKDSIILSLFEPREEKPTGTSAPQPARDTLADDIPF